MWLWQQKSIRERQLLWAKLFLISFSFHFVFFIWLFFLYHDASFDIAITVESKLFRPGAPVIFVPFKQKETVRAQNNNSLVQRPLSVVKQKEPKTSIQKRKENKVKAKKEQTKKPPEKKGAVKNKDKTSKLVEKKKASTEQIKTKKDSKKETKNQINNAQNKQAKTQKSTGNQIGGQASYREVEAQRRQALLQKELANCWKPPIGVPQDCVCQIKVAVNWDGTIKELAVAQSSGILMYDVAARSALYTMKMPSWSKGKSLTIMFKQ